MHAWRTTFAASLLTGLLACGGAGNRSTDTPVSQKMDAEAAVALSVPFLTTETNQAGELDGSGPFAAGEAVSMAQPSHPGCVTVGETTANSVTWTYTNCTGPHGWTWNGVVVISWSKEKDGSTLVKHDHRNLVGAKDGRTWTINGIKDHLINLASKTVALTTETGFTKTFNNGTTTTTYTYGCSLVADWSTAGQRKLYGTWSLIPTTGEAISGTIAQATPLTWDKAAGCCYPVAGTLILTKGSQSAAIVHSLPCGTVTINGTAKALQACGM